MSQTLEYELRISQEVTSSLGATRMVDMLGDPVSTESTRVIFYPDNVRQIVNLVTGASRFERKSTLKEYTGPYYKYVVSEELPVSTVTTDPTGTEVLRMRYIYRWEGHELHITFRTTIDTRITSSVSIEVETRTELPTSTVNALAEKVMRLHNGTTLPSLGALVSGMKNAMRASGLTSPTQLQRPYDLTWRGFTADNLLRNPTAISYKADGIRVLLALTTAGTFFITSNLGIQPISTERYESNTLLDGELVDTTYYAFDILMANGQDMKASPYDVRHQRLSEMMEGYEPVSNIQIVVKPIRVPRTSEEFFSAVQEMTDVPVDTDGLILTPLAQPYSAPVYKWKPADHMSVDFFVGAGKVLHTFENGQLKPHPELTVKEPERVPAGIVGEFGYEGNSTWSFQKRRLDKATPNAERVYEAISSLLRDPITLDAMTGRSLRPMRKYHNRIKGQLYEYLRKQGVSSLTDIGAGRGGDISKWASNGFSVVAVEPDERNIFGEDGLLDRARKGGATIEEEQVDTGGEDLTIYDIEADTWNALLYPVPAQKYPADIQTDALTLYNVATFLGPSLMEFLLDNAVVANGYLVILVIDGKCLLRTFLSQGSTYSSDLISISKVPTVGGRCGTVDETFGDLGCISIQLHDSATVDRAQIEGLVDVEVLVEQLKKGGWAVTTDMILDDEELLGSEGTKYTSCQRLLVATRVRVGDVVVRRSYRPLPAGKRQKIDSPYGPLVRIGMPKGSVAAADNTLFSALLYATRPSFRQMGEVAQVVTTSQYLRQLQGKQELPQPHYLIFEDTWDMVQPEGGQYVRYPAFAGVTAPRSAGVVLMYNAGYWDLLAREDMNGNLSYIW